MVVLLDKKNNIIQTKMDSQKNTHNFSSYAKVKSDPNTQHPPKSNPKTT